MNPFQRRHFYGCYGAEKSNDNGSYLWPPVLRELSSLPAGSRVLDAGCGNGYFSRELERRRYQVCGVDLEETGIGEARKLCPAARFEIASVYDDLRSLFGEPFDAVVSFEVIEHLYDPRAFLGRVRECLCPAGVLVLSTPYHGYWKNLAIALTGKCDRHFSALWDGGHIKFWSRHTLTASLEECGFRVAKFIGAGRLPYLWKSMILVARRG